MRELEEVGPGVGGDFGVEAAGGLADGDGAAVDFGEKDGVEDLGGGAGGGGGALVQEEDVGGDGREFFDVVGDEDDGGWIVLVEEALDGGEDLFAGEEVQACRGFVEEEKLWCTGEGAGDEGADFFAVGESLVGVVAEFGEADAGEEFFGLGVLGGGRLVVEAQGGEEAGEDDLVGGEGGFDVELAAGLDDADEVAEGGEIGFAVMLAEDVDIAGGGPHVTGDDAGEGGFSGAVGAEDGGASVGSDGPGDIAEDGGVAALEGDVLEVDDGLGVHGEMKP